MKGTVKFFAAAAFAALICGAGFGLDNAVEFSTPYIVEDTTRDILATMHSRLDAFRKVALPVAAEPAAAEPAVAVGTEAFGSLVLPEYVTCDSRYLNRFWGGGLGAWQDADEQGEYSGYEYKGQGVLLGYDRAFGAATVGIAGSYVKGDYEVADASRHNSEIKQYSGHVYATYNTSKGFFFTLTGGYTYGDAEIDETNIATKFKRYEDFHSQTFNAGLRMGYDFEPTPTVVITPSVGGNFFHTKVSEHDAVDETGTYRLREGRHNLVELPFDIQVAKEFDFGKNRLLQISANGGYAYNLTRKAANGELTLAGVDEGNAIDRDLGRSTWKAGAGARLKMDQWDIGVKYDFLTRSDFSAHRVMGTVGFSF